MLNYFDAPRESPITPIGAIGHSATMLNYFDAPPPAGKSPQLDETASKIMKSNCKLFSGSQMVHNFRTHNATKKMPCRIYAIRTYEHREKGVTQQ
jgi:hypothetical protein